MKTRVISGLVMAPLLIIVYFGGIVLYAACCVIGFFAIREFFAVFESESAEPSSAGATVRPLRPVHWIAYLSIALLYAVLPAANATSLPFSILLVLWAVLITMLSLGALLSEKYALEDSLVTAIGIFYVVFLSFHVAMIGGFFPPDDVWMRFHNPVWLVVLTAFGTDIFAYFTGSLLGKHKLCPKISPKKTVEGAIGGVVGSVLLCGVFGYFALPELFVHCLIIGVLGSIVSQLGDLVASAVKRRRGVKDYGHLIPGHGGVLDRIDSGLFTAPLVFYYIYIMYQIGF
jgi:phosphatidate cytidylyltransferase